MAVYISDPPFSEYLSCGEKANGPVTDYYFDGTIRQAGTFKDGQLDGFLKIYSHSGKLKEIRFKHKKKWSTTEYYANGNIKSYNGNINGFEQKEYYEGEKLKSYETRSGFMLYSTKGSILQHLTWKKIRRSKFFKDDNRELYQYTFRRYKDSGLGYKTQETIFESYTEPYFFNKKKIDEELSNNTIRHIGFYSGEEQLIRIEVDKNGPEATLSIKIGKKWHKERLATREDLSAAIVEYAKEFN